MNMRDINSPEYKSKCMEWALKMVDRSLCDPKASDVLDAAKAFYAYVYGDGAETDTKD